MLGREKHIFNSFDHSICSEGASARGKKMLVWFRRS